ncbi:MAG: lactate utilization protein [Chloroflexi bacterium]|nr:lactate utilization protein [Chloroflexota bacterium]
MADRNEFLQMVRDSLGVASGRVIEPDDATAFFEDQSGVSDQAAAVREHADSSRADLLDEMADAAEEIGWVIHRSTSPEDAVAAVTEICRSAGAKSVLRSTHDVFERVPVDAALSAEGMAVSTATRDRSDDDAVDLERRLELRERAFDTDVGITGVDYAVAETGTVVINPRQGVSRLVSLTPPIHIAILEAGQVLPSLDELFLLAHDDFQTSAHRGMINLISGPSRTADIEANLVIGVHGPVEVHLVIVG